MKRYLVCAWLVLLGAGAVQAQTPGKAIGSYLYDPAYSLDYAIRGKARAYVPQPGDVLLATDPNFFWKVTHAMAFAFEPHNSAIIVQRRDGSLGVLEAGPNDTLWVGIPELLPHLKEYADKGPVWIRKHKMPITPEQNARLTDFAERQNNKRFAIGRLGILLTPLRDRGPIPYRMDGEAARRSRGFYCAELVMEACVATGLVDHETARPSATFPHDLFYDQSFNRYIAKHLPLANDWEPPAHWKDYVVDGAK